MPFKRSYRQTCEIFKIKNATHPRSTFSFVSFAFAESIGRLTGKEAAAMARRKKEQEFLQVLESDNLAGKGMSEA